jgi:uncharacterized repeat protein (TIGR01451 family)
MLVILGVAVIGLSLSAFAQDESTLSIVKTADSSRVHPGEVVTYVISLENGDTGSASVTMTDSIPHGTHFVEGSATGGATYSEGQVIWSGTLEPAEIHEITFQVTVDEPGTEGPLPIYNQACADDGSGEVCDSVIVYSGWHKVFLPLTCRQWGSLP